MSNEQAKLNKIKSWFIWSKIEFFFQKKKVFFVIGRCDLIIILLYIVNKDIIILLYIVKRWADRFCPFYSGVNHSNVLKLPFHFFAQFSLFLAKTTFVMTFGSAKTNIMNRSETWADIFTYIISQLPFLYFYIKN